MPEGKTTTALPPDAALPLWQPAHVFVAGVDTLLEVKDGTAKTGAAGNCAPINRRANIVANEMTSAEDRIRFIFYSPDCEI